jgi:tetratricopeptide (TPR) repeat protein
MRRFRMTSQLIRTPAALLLLALALAGAGVASAQVAPECVPAVKALQSGDLEVGAEQLQGCVDDGFGVERAQARVLLAELRAREGNLDEAMRILDDIDRLAVDLQGMAPAELERGEVTIGTPGYLRRSARSIAPVMGQAAYMRVIFLLEQGHALEAAGFVRDLMDAEYSSAQEESLGRILEEEMALVQMAAALQRSGDVEECARFMREIPLRGNPKQPLKAAQIHSFAMIYTTCHEGADEVDTGIAHYEGLFQPLIARDRKAALPGTEAQQRNLFTAMLIAEARLRMLKEDFGERTRFILDQAIDQGADVPETRYMRAYLYLLMGEPARALPDVMQAERLLPGHPTHNQFAGLLQAIEDRLY